MTRMLQLALRSDILKRSAVVGVVVGTILNVINQGDALLGAQPFEVTKCILTYIVPYCVATYGGVGALINLEAGE